MDSKYNLPFGLLLTVGLQMPKPVNASPISEDAAVVWTAAGAGDVAALSPPKTEVFEVLKLK